MQLMNTVNIPDFPPAVIAVCERFEADIVVRAVCEADYHSNQRYVEMYVELEGEDLSPSDLKQFPSKRFAGIWKVKTCRPPTALTTPSDPVRATTRSGWASRPRSPTSSQTCRRTSRPWIGSSRR